MRGGGVRGVIVGEGVRCQVRSKEVRGGKGAGMNREKRGFWCDMRTGKRKDGDGDST